MHGRAPSQLFSNGAQKISSVDKIVDKEAEGGEALERRHRTSTKNSDHTVGAMPASSGAPLRQHSRSLRNATQRTSGGMAS